jgi:hypothetical protein
MIERDVDERYAIAAGTLSTGFVFYGHFSSGDEAAGWAQRRGLPEFQIVVLREPEVER